MSPQTTEVRPSAGNSRGFLPRELGWFLVLSAVLWVVSIAYVGLKLRYGKGVGHGLPPLLTAAPFGDLDAFVHVLPMVHQPDFFKPEYGWNYSAPCIFLYEFLYFFRVQGHKHLSYLFFVFSGLALLGWRLSAALTRRGLPGWKAAAIVVATAVLSWPIAFGLHQGNTDTLIWMGAAVAVWAYYRRMWWVAAVLIGIVGAFKIYPILLIGLFVAPKKFLQAAACVATFVGVTAAGLAFIGPSVPAAYAKITGGVKLVADLGFYPNNVDRDYLTFEHSLVSLIRVCLTSHLDAMRVVFQHYLPVAGALMGIFFLVWMLKMPRVNQVLVILVAAVILPPTSYDYTLELMYIPWAWLAMICVSAAAEGRRVKGMMAMMICFALVCAPELFFKFQGTYSYGQLKGVVLLVMLWLAARYRFEDEPARLVGVL